MTARDDYRAAEARLAEVEQQIAAIHESRSSWTAYETGMLRTQPRPRPPGDLADLLLQRERLQEESYKAYRRVVAEGLR